MEQDHHHLNLLSIFHFVAGGINLLLSCFPLIHLFIGIAILVGGLDGEAPSCVGLFFIVISLAFITFDFTLSGLMIAAGIKLKKRESHTFCLVVAAIECIIMPYGTVLGVFSLIVLTRQSVKSLFGIDTPAT